MTKERITIKPSTGTVIETPEQADVALGEVAQIKTTLSAIESGMNTAITEIRAAHQERIDKLQTKLLEKTGSLKDWADNNPQLWTRRKSLDLTHGTLGYRTGNPKAKPLKGWTWDRVKEKVALIARNYLRTSEEVNKEGLIADRELLGPDKLRELGVQIVQDETFFIEPKLEKVKEAA